MATVSISKSSLNVNTGGSRRVTTSGVALFTTASNQYAILTMAADSTTGKTVSIGGVVLPELVSTTPVSVYVAPSTAVVLSATSGALSTSWVIFQNT